MAWSIDNSGIASRSVGQKLPNNYGLYDMSGNVFEWVWDWSAEEAYTFDSDLDPQCARVGNRRVVRGGSWKRTDFASRGYLPSSPRHGSFGQKYRATGR